MSRTKPVRIFGRMVWVPDNAHDIVLAHLVEAAEVRGYESSSFLGNWRVWASIRDLSLSYPDGDSPSPDEMQALLTDVRSRIVTRGDVVSADLESWSVLEGEHVSGGFLRSPTVRAIDLIDVVDSFSALVAGAFRDDPPGGAWLVGAGPENTTIRMRRKET